MTRIRLIAPLGIAVLVAFSATACSPAAQAPDTSKGPAAAGATPGARATPVGQLPAAPPTRYTVGCKDLLPATSIAPLFSHTMAPVDPGENYRQALYPQLPQTYFIGQLGGIDCMWSDGHAAAVDGQAAYLSVLPLAAARWKFFLTSENQPATATSYVECTPDEGDGANTCHYDALVDGSWLSVGFNEMVPTPGSNPSIMPGPVKTVVTAVTAALTAAGPPAAPVSPPATSITLSNTPGAILTADQVKTAIGTQGAVGLDCKGIPDGPWSVANEAEEQVDSSLGCFFTSGSSGGGYGLLYWLPGGEWAEKRAVAATTSETPLNIPGHHDGDAAAMFVNDQKDHVADLLVGGNWI
ncbi:MAG TPA: hypothetical protein VGI56_09915, partial [Galbitalea sp.]